MHKKSNTKVAKIHAFQLELKNVFGSWPTQKIINYVFFFAFDPWSSIAWGEKISIIIARKVQAHSHREEFSQKRHTPLLPNAAFLHVGLYVASFLKIGTHLKMRKLMYYKIFRNPIILLMKRPTVKHNEEPPTASYFLRIPKCMLVAYSTIQLHVHQCDILICVHFYKRL